MITLSALVLPDRDSPADLIADVREAEAVGVRTVWTYDHLTWPPLEDRPWHAAVPLLAAAAASTTKVRLGTQVATPNYRHPVTFAKEIMTLDRLSAGRLDIGVGAGAESADAAVLGGPARSRKERTERFTEWLGMLDHLLTHDVSTLRGRHFSAVDAHQMPGCVQQPRVPLTVAAAGERALRLAARYGQAWVTYGGYQRQHDPESWFQAVGAQSQELTRALAAEGRPASDIRRIAQIPLDVTWPFESPERYADCLGRLKDLDFDEITVHWPRAHDRRGTPSSALAFVAAAHGL
ncbi:LLM class flavin-dependent oxidoreductase [Sphaerisporangium perillae]|uniref:LLM class flavin-dependent oxidoreductase n=1 Tax=Sphaerisporangium perillae TaxID=2935860 RepID=UPI00200C0B1B|nr:LLM class flavin-dependent oxidoreductase [Sphaerisporangium perillae]